MTRAHLCNTGRVLVPLLGQNFGIGILAEVAVRAPGHAFVLQLVISDKDEEEEGMKKRKRPGEIRGNWQPEGRIFLC